MSEKNYYKELIKLNVLEKLQVIKTPAFISMGITTVGAISSYSMVSYGIEASISPASFFTAFAGFMIGCGSFVAMVNTIDEMSHFKSSYNKLTEEIKEKKEDLINTNTEANKLIHGYEFRSGGNILVYHFQNLLKENLSDENIEKAISKTDSKFELVLGAICKSDKKINNKNLESILNKLDISTIVADLFNASNKDIKKQIISIIAKDEVRLEGLKIKIEEFKKEGLTNEKLSSSIKKDILKEVLSIEKMISEVSLIVEEKTVIDPLERMRQMRGLAKQNTIPESDSNYVKKII